jgi:hypothetical protein
LAVDATDHGGLILLALLELPGSGLASVTGTGSISRFPSSSKRRLTDRPRVSRSGLRVPVVEMPVSVLGSSSEESSG